MTLALMALIVSAAPLSGAVRAVQLLPTPRDGDIRTVYWELQNRSEIFLTLELKTRDGKTAPLVTFGVEFPGKAPKARPTAIDVRAYAGTFWAPRIQFWLALDDGSEKIDLVPSGWWQGLATGPASDYLPVTMTLETLDKVVEAGRVTGNVLGFDFELSDTQKEALRAFRDRIMTM